jgi:hypothetical protein
LFSRVFASKAPRLPAHPEDDLFMERVRMRKLVLISLLLSVAAPLSAQHRQAALFQGEPVKVAAVVQPQEAASTTRMVIGGLLGGAVGLVGGGLLGAVIGSDDESEENWVKALQGAVIGGTIGESLGLAVGVHLGNRRQGNLPLGMVASTAIGIAGLLALYGNEDPPVGPILLTATPLAQLATTILIERR